MNTGKTYQLVTTQHSADCEGINFKPLADGTVEVTSWACWDGGPESGPGSRHSTQVMPLQDARDLYREARQEGLFPPK
jgi:hypothetical protein